MGNESNKENTDGDAKKRIDQIKDVTPADPNPGENPKDLTLFYLSVQQLLWTNKLLTKTLLNALVNRCSASV